MSNIEVRQPKRRRQAAPAETQPKSTKTAVAVRRPKSLRKHISNDLVPDVPDLASELVQPNRGQRQVSGKPKRKTTGKAKPSKVKLALAVVVGVLILLIGAIAFLPGFTVTKVEYATNGILSQDEVWSKTELKQGQNMVKGFSSLNFSYRKASNAIKAAFPSVEEVSVKFAYPGTVQVHLTERIPIACVKTEAGYVQLDKNGIAIREELTPPEGLPQLVISLKSVCVLGKKLDFADDAYFASALNVMTSSILLNASGGATNTALLSRLISVTPAENGTVYILFRLEQGQMLTVKLSTETTVEQTMRWIVYAIEKEVLKGRGNGLLDTTVKPRPVFTPNEGIPKEITGGN